MQANKQRTEHKNVKPSELCFPGNHKTVPQISLVSVKLKVFKLASFEPTCCLGIETILQQKYKMKET